MNKSLILHATLACLSSLVAFVAWHLPEEDSSEEKVLLSGKIKRVEWEEEKWQVSLYKKDDGALWVNIRQGDDLAEKPKEKSYVASKQAEALFKGLNSLKVNRTLGKQDNLADFGLAESQERVRLYYGDQMIDFDIGGGIYGKAQIYLKDQNQNIHLIAANKLSGLRHGATGLIERKAFSFALGEMDRIAVQEGGRERKLVLRKDTTSKRAFLADPAEPDTKLERTSNWLERLLRLRIIDVDGEKSDVKPFFVVKFFVGNEEIETIKLWKPSERMALMEIKRYRGPVMISKHEAQNLIDDLDLVFNEGR